MTVTTATLESIERKEHVSDIAQCRWGIEQGYLRADFVATPDGQNRLALFLTPAGREALKWRRERAAEREIISIVRGMIHDDLTVEHPGSETVRRLRDLLKGIEK